MITRATFARVVRFAAVGAVGTVAHYALLIALVSGLGTSPLVGASAGFVLGALVNYMLSRWWVFQSGRSHGEALPRFFLVALTGLAWTAGLMFLFTEWLGIHYLLAQLIVTAMLLLWHYAGNALWTFRRPLVLGLLGLASLVAQPLPARAAAQWQGAAFEGDRAALARLAEAGAGVVRVYGESHAWVLDEAARLGLKVVMGLSVARPAKGFRLDDAAAVRAQEQAILRFVQRHRHHPALLAWGVGNEVELGSPEPLPSWREVNRLAGLIKALDPAHPTMMAVSDNSDENLALLAGCCSQVDIVGINVYAGSVFALPERMRRAGITKPVVIAEFGPIGQWQAGTKPWGAPIEPTSTEKAWYFRDAMAFVRSQPALLGAFPFLWGAKHEQTGTWHGLLLADGSLTAMTDALTLAWGRPVPEPAPRIRGIGIGADEFAPRAEISAGVDAVSFDGTPLTTVWEVRAEEPPPGQGTSFDVAPPRIEVTVLHADAATVRFVAPERPGAYRLFMTLRDRKGKVATANLPFRVR